MNASPIFTPAQLRHPNVRTALRAAASRLREADRFRGTTFESGYVQSAAALVASAHLHHPA